jgi:hypothetical protein
MPNPLSDFLYDRFVKPRVDADVAKAQANNRALAYGVVTSDAQASRAIGQQYTIDHALLYAIYKLNRRRLRLHAEVDGRGARQGLGHASSTRKAARHPWRAGHRSGACSRPPGITDAHRTPTGDQHRRSVEPWSPEGGGLLCYGNQTVNGRELTETSR